MNAIEAKKRLRSVGLRATSTRIAILCQFSKATHPLSHSQMVEALGDICADQATVYRTLVTFSKQGLIREVGRVHGVARYEFNQDSSEPHKVHPHFVCSLCGSISCMP